MLLFPAGEWHCGKFLLIHRAVGGSDSGKRVLMWCEKKPIFSCGFFFYGLSRVLRTICCRLQLLVHPNKCSHAVLQDLRCAGAAVRGIHRSDFWNRQIVCLHVGPRLGQTVLGFKDFSLKAGKKREKEAVVWRGSRRISCLQGVPCYKGRKEMPRRESGRRAERPAKPLSDSDTFY